MLDMNTQTINVKYFHLDKQDKISQKFSALNSIQFSLRQNHHALLNLFFHCFYNLQFVDHNRMS